MPVTCPHNAALYQLLTSASPEHQARMICVCLSALDGRGQLSQSRILWLRYDLAGLKTLMCCFQVISLRNRIDELQKQ